MTALLTDRRCLEHEPPRGYPERPARLRAMLDHRRDGGEPVEEGVSHPRRREAVLAVHDERYVERFERAAARGDALIDSADNPLTDRTPAAAWAAVEVALVAADRIATGQEPRAFALVRPPGHHAERGQAMGFCYFNNAAAAAQHLLDHHGLSRVAIFDFDVHHGNGTQHIFEARPDVLYASTHQFPFYPGTGAAGERGTGAGQGATVNVPLPAGTGDAGYEEAIRGTVLPALADFGPELILVSAGFDAWKHDPIGGMQVSEAGFRSWGTWIRETAEAVSGGRVLSLLEGGYDLEALPRLVSAYVEGLEDGGG